MEKQLIIKDQSELRKAARELLEFCSSRKIFAIYGKMGVGKTTFIKEICHELGTDDRLSSPSFAIVNEYLWKNGPIYHIDLFRIKNIEEAIDAGIEEYLWSENYCFIEWPELVSPLLPESSVEVRIDHSEGQNRIITIRQQ